MGVKGAECARKRGDGAAALKGRVEPPRTARTAPTADRSPPPPTPYNPKSGAPLCDGAQPQGCADRPPMGEGGWGVGMPEGVRGRAAGKGRGKGGDTASTVGGNTPDQSPRR